MRRVGSGKFVYEEVRRWGQFPEDWTAEDAPAVAVDSQDRVYVLARHKDSLLVFDRDGHFLTSWAEGAFERPHGMCIGPDDAVYLIDDSGHAVYKFTTDGELLMTIETRDHPADTGYDGTEFSVTRSGPPFNKPTGAALSPEGDLYVSDGYGNARVHKFAPNGTLLLSWGEPGAAPGQFRLPHSIWVDKQDRVWVVDRENNRIQIFDARGEFLSQWTDLIRPTDVFIDDEETVYVSELSPRVSIFTIEGKLLARWGSQGQDEETALFVAPHTIAVDSRGDLYVGEVSMTHAKIDRGSRTVQKFARRT